LNIDPTSISPTGDLRIVPLGSAGLTSAEEQYLTSLLAEEYQLTYNAPLAIARPSAHQASQSVEAVKTALRILCEADVELYDELRQLITDIVIVEADGLNAGSSFKAFGVILLRALQPGQTWTAYIEHLAHEAAHHHLFAVCTLDPIFDGASDAVYRSPLRKELRPLSAIYHAMFVLCRIIRVLSRLRALAAYRDFERTALYNFPNDSPLREQFRLAYDTIAKHASLTPVGHALLESAQEMMRRYVVTIESCEFARE
jgi:HEXXH motif-containing protein